LSITLSSAASLIQVEMLFRSGCSEDRCSRQSLACKPIHILVLILLTQSTSAFIAPPYAAFSLDNYLKGSEGLVPLIEAGGRYNKAEIEDKPKFTDANKPLMKPKREMAQWQWEQCEFSPISCLLRRR